MKEKEILKNMVLPERLRKVFETCPGKIIIPESREELFSLALGNEGANFFEIAYDIPGKGRFVEATVSKCKNGASVNYTEAYMRRRDPNCMYIADDLPTDKPRFEDKFGEKFDNLREESFSWLEGEDLIVMAFMAGGSKLGYEALLVAPANTGFFAAGLADLQELVPLSKIRKGFNPKSVLYLTPTIRHTYFEGKQIVVHNRLEGMHELFCNNLYPGPSAKKGAYGILLNIGELEGWVTAHTSAVRIITPYKNTLNIMHEGASGGGKSEMLEPIHKQADGTILLAKNIVTDEEVLVELHEESELEPVADDMAMCHPSLQNGKKLVLTDAEDGWFLRIDHIQHYGTDPYLERLCTEPKKPLIFFNMDGTPDATCLIWEHTMDTPEKRCPNPRVIMPRDLIPNIVNDAVDIDVRSFGTRMPPSTKENPSYGVMGLFHIIPPALAWIWRLVAPRGYANPSIVDTGGMSSEGVGSYWAFATGKMVKQANLLLDQILNTPETKYILLPNQYVGSYKVGFAAEWVTREYLSRKGGVKIASEKLVEAKCTILGYALDSMKLDGHYMKKELLQPHLQPELGLEAYETGAKILTDFFKKELKQFIKPELSELGKKIIDLVMNDAPISEYEKLTPMK